MFEFASEIIARMVGLPVVHAQGPSLLYFDTFIGWIGTVLAHLVPVLMGLALVLFIWGIVQFIFASGDEKEIATGKQRMIWGIIALFVIVAVWGLVGLIIDITDVGPDTAVAPFTGF
jgi:hypothetical protein